MASRLALLSSILVAFLSLTFGAQAAFASHSETVFFEAPRELLNPASRPAALRELTSLGVHALRVVLYWRDVAPSTNARTKPSFDATNPAKYNWSEYDGAIDAARALGWKVLLTVTGPVPRWATAGGRDHVTSPSANDYRQFMVAVGRHYGGVVQWISIWNEPNQPQYLLPQYRGNTLVSPLLYRSLFLAGYGGLETSGALRHVTVLMGETSPIGDRAADIPAPLAFMRGVLCLNSHYVKARGCAKLPAAGYAQHPYADASGPFMVPSDPDDVTIGTLGRLVTALDRAAAAGAIRKGMPVYVTEFGIQSHPDPFLGVPVAQQAEYLALSEKLAWNNPRVASYDQYLLRDDPPESGNLFARWAGFQSGLEFSGGGVKPALAGWRLPLAVTRVGTTVSLWGILRPTKRASTAKVEYSSDHGHSWRSLLIAHSDSRGYWTAHGHYAAGREWRVVWRSPGGVTYTGAPIRSYTSTGTVG